jgi:hypothetical protein
LEELFELLKSLRDEDACELLARIRAGVDPSEIVDTVRHGNMLMQFASTVGSSRDSVSSDADGGMGSSSGSGGKSGSGNILGDSQVRLPNRMVDEKNVKPPDMRQDEVAGSGSG